MEIKTFITITVEKCPEGSPDVRASTTATASALRQLHCGIGEWCESVISSLESDVDAKIKEQKELGAN